MTHTEILLRAAARARQEAKAIAPDCPQGDPSAQAGDAQALAERGHHALMQEAEALERMAHQQPVAWIDEANLMMADRQTPTETMPVYKGPVFQALTDMDLCALEYAVEALRVIAQRREVSGDVVTPVDDIRKASSRAAHALKRIEPVLLKIDAHMARLD